MFSLKAQSATSYKTSVLNSKHSAKPYYSDLAMLMNLAKEPVPFLSDASTIWTVSVQNYLTCLLEMLTYMLSNKIIGIKYRLDWWAVQK